MRLLPVPPMCLILLAYKTHPDADLVLGGNRDEFRGRPSAPPAVICRDPVIHAGRDLEAGGTWLGRNGHGMVAALTNRRPGADDPADAPRSRGEIVLELLRRRSPEEAARWIGALDPGQYRPFNVLFGSAGGCFAHGSDQGPHPQRLEPGFHVLSNSTLNDDSWPKVARSRRFLEQSRTLDGESFLVAMQAFLCDPALPETSTPEPRLPELPGASPGQPSGNGDGKAGVKREPPGALGAVFVETPGYGTVSATILTSGGKLGERYYFAEAEAMRRARQGWARETLQAEQGSAAVVPDPHGNPFRLLTFAAEPR